MAASTYKIYVFSLAGFSRYIGNARVYASTGIFIDFACNASTSATIQFNYLSHCFCVDDLVFEGANQKYMIY